jgi:hypothetical protein
VGTNVDTWGGAFLSRNSILVGLLKTHYPNRRTLPEVLANYPHVRLRSPREVARFVASFEP